MVHKDEAIRAGLADYYGRQEHLREIEEKILADFPRKIAGQIQQAAKNFLRQIEQNSQDPSKFTFIGDKPTNIINPNTWHSDWRNDSICLQERAVNFLVMTRLGFDPGQHFVSSTPTADKGSIQYTDNSTYTPGRTYYIRPI